MVFLSFSKPSGFPFDMIVGPGQMVVEEVETGFFQGITLKMGQRSRKIDVIPVFGVKAQELIAALDLIQARILVTEQLMDIPHKAADDPQSRMRIAQIGENLVLGPATAGMVRMATGPLAFLYRLLMANEQISMMPDLGLYGGRSRRRIRFGTTP